MIIRRLLLVMAIIFSLLGGCDTQEGAEGNKSLEIKGKVIVLNFWATWCPPCRKEMPLLESTYKRYKEKGLVILGIDYNEDRERVLKFTQEMGVTFPIILDKELKLTRKYGVLSLPATFFIDKKGIVRDQHKGEIVEEIIATKVEPLLSESGLEERR
ncbi:MAG: TlpA family protein disulfide reductase [Nitrospirae bacterium]|nr:TlpA family protein disulfide reductase [Nitrospirota bacterium]